MVLMFAAIERDSFFLQGNATLGKIDAEQASVSFAVGFQFNMFFI